MKIRIFLLVVFLFPSLVAAQYKFPLKISANKRYVTDQNGTPYLIIGDAAHRPISNISNSQYATYINDRQAQGFTSLNLFGSCISAGSCLTSTGATNTTGQAFDGTLPFSSTLSGGVYDFCTPVAAYWNQVHQFVAAANAAGMVVGPFQPLPWGNGWSTAFQNSTNQTVTTCLGFTGTRNFIIGAYLGNLFKDTTVFWAVGQDFNSSSLPGCSDLTTQADFMAGIASTYPNAIIGAQLNFFVSDSSQGYTICAGGTTGNTEYAANLNSNFVYTYSGPWDQVHKAYNATPIIPVYLGESNYEGGNNDGLGHAGTAFDTRAEGWWALTSGAVGYIFGNTNVEHFVSGWPSSLDTIATSQIQFMELLLNRAPWPNFVPDQSNVLLTSGFGSCSTVNGQLDSSTCATATFDGSSYAIVYTPVSTNALSINMAKFTSAVVSAQWYDPTTGRYQSVQGSPFANSGTQVFTPPTTAHSDLTGDWVLVLQAVPWSVPLAASRGLDWSVAGANPGPLFRPICQTVQCTTLFSSVTDANLSSAINNAPANTVILFPTGSFTLSPFTIQRDNVTLRGQGADQTKLTITGTTSCPSNSGGVSVMVGICGSNNWWPGAINNQATFTAGFSQGTTVITLSAVPNLGPGSMIILQQNKDSAGFPTSADILVCDNSATPICSTEGSSLVNGNNQSETHLVIGVNGTNVTIYPPVIAPNFRTAQSPIAWWPNHAVTGVGIENMTIDGSAGTGARTVMEIDNGIGNWITGVRSVIRAADAQKGYHIHQYLGAFNTIRSNYLYGYRDVSQENYSITVNDEDLIENNIVEQNVVPFSQNGPGGSALVLAYNYATNNVGINGVTGWEQGPLWHNMGTFYTLMEGNDIPKLEYDAIHGTHNLDTAFRNYLHGQVGQLNNTALFVVRFHARNVNAIGNVLGCGTAATCPSGSFPYYTSYENDVPSAQGPDAAVFNVGGAYSGNATVTGTDSQTVADFLKWGNCDTVTNTCRFLSSEVPSGLTNFANPVPASQTLPSSFYLTAKPLWWSGVPFPATGPDVTTGTVPGMNGHTYKNPARLCYESLSTDPTYSGTTPPVKSFNASVCYSGAAPTPAPGITFSPTTVQFGNVTQGTTSAPITVTVTNSGNAALILSTPYFTIPPIDTDFVNAGTGTCANGATVNAGASCTVVVTFTPQSSTTESATLTINGNASGTVNMFGTGVANQSAVTLSQATINFPNQAVNTTSSGILVTLTSTGNAALTMTSITITGTNPSNFSILGTGTTCPLGAGTLAVNSSCNVVVAFSPTAALSYSANLTFTTNASTSPNNVALSGSGQVSNIVSGSGSISGSAAINVHP